MILKFRTILILLMATTVVSLGTGLSIWSLWTSTSAARDAAISSASQQAVSGVIAVEHVIGVRESLISSVATMIGHGGPEQEAVDNLIKYWKNFRLSKNFVNHGAFKYSKLSGAGVIAHRESPEEIVTRQIDGSFLALDVRTGKTRIVPDMRQEPWFQAARESKEVGYLDMRPTLCPFDGKWRRCITIHTPVIDRNGKFIGAIGLELTMDWYRQFLMEAMDRSAFPTRSFGVEKKADGTLNLIADTEEETDKLDMFAEGQSEGFVDALTYGDGIFSGRCPGHAQHAGGF
ncbi:MAG: hypothetical protein FJ261_02070 [Planctomycetes bacterium]|nr:hypothetical protein [Planctomycetota bacterium]